MEPEKMNEWLGAVEYLMTSDEGCFVENDFGYMIKIRNMIGGRYEKYDRFLEFCGVTDSAAEAVLWLYENNKGDKGMCYNCHYKTDSCQEGLHCIRDSEED